MQIIPRRGQVRPWGSIPRIDWSHPLTAGLVSYNYDHGGCLIDLVGGGLSAQTSSTGGPTIAPQTSRFGFATKLSNAAPSDGLVSALNQRSGNLAAAGPWSVATGLFSTATNVGQTILSVVDSGLNFAVNLQPFGTNQFRMNNPVFYLTNSGTFSQNAYHTFDVSVDSTGAAGDVFCDGVLDGTISGTLTVASTTLQTLYNCIRNDGLGSGGMAGFMYYVAQWKRPRSAGERLQLHQDPYCFLIYPEAEMEATLVGVTVSGYTPYNPWPLRAPILAQ